MLFGFHPFLPIKLRYSKDYDLKELVECIINDPFQIPLPEYNQLIETRVEGEHLVEESKEPEIALITEEAKDLLN